MALIQEQHNYKADGRERGNDRLSEIEVEMKEKLSAKINREKQLKNFPSPLLINSISCYDGEEK